MKNIYSCKGIQLYVDMNIFRGISPIMDEESLQPVEQRAELLFNLPVQDKVEQRAELLLNLPVQDKVKTDSKWKYVKKWMQVNVAFIGALLVLALIIYAMMRIFSFFQKYHNST